MSAGFTGPPVHYCDRCKVALPPRYGLLVHCLECHMTVEPGHYGWVAIEVDSTCTKPRKAIPCPTCEGRIAVAGRRSA